MNYEKYTNAERIIAKIDNDFNIDNSDWISRVPAWIYDCLNQLDILETEYTTKKCSVINGYIKFKGCFKDDFKVYDENNNEIKEYKGKVECCNPSTGGSRKSFLGSVVIDTEYEQVEEEGHQHLKPIHTVKDIYSNSCETTTYTKIDDNIIYINDENIKTVFIKYKVLKSEYSDIFKIKLPLIPNNGTLIEAITYYCMYKMLCRGNKHPVFNLAASQYGTNPYYMWIKLKDEARRSVINNNVDEKLDTDAWKRFFYNSTFYNE